MKKAGIATIGFAMSESVPGSGLVLNPIATTDKTRIDLIGFSNRSLV